jgi:hypothetical protein
MAAQDDRLDLVGAAEDKKGKGIGRRPLAHQ